MKKGLLRRLLLLLVCKLLRVASFVFLELKGRGFATPLPAQCPKRIASSSLWDLLGW